ncbi:microcin C transport system substrate-binding protein [Andreprevotia lacus DSM 23236]|jgi:microcin C transport system substrate-binding protein|uniref:Microcin C transport system substrate-binding protein n=1 Tax=Andreprevotia lacus DSM 23236 TaxID=1121001 RepID=A0A1W1XD29_9NEIS|nr:extracellular solute-binding protein [Andreprevotia lacus]SMC21799.1 microcin C transport system substrate-binding protein [Andreprevotia lacus DSM 23236]
MRAILLLLSLLASPAVLAAHAMALGYTPKYPAGFTHFDYVNPAAPKGGELLMANPDRRTSFDTFNPFILKGTAPAGVGELIFESLTVGSMDEVATSYCLLADDIRPAADGLSVTFHINPKARFHNGDAVTAADAKYSFDTLNGKLAAPQYAAALADVARAEVLDKLTIRYVFKRKNPELAQIVGSLPVFSPKWGDGAPFDKIGLQNPVGSGPYRIGPYETGRQLTLLRDPGYWGRDLPTRRGMFNFDRLTWRMYKDDLARLEAFKAGQFDFNVENVARNWVRLYTGPRFAGGELVKREFVHHNTAGFQGFILNTRRPMFADKRVRQALGLALDFDWLNRQLFYNQYVRTDSYYANSELAATGSPGANELKLLEPLRKQLDPAVFGPVPLPASTAPPRSLRANLLQARDLLAQAGWTYRDGALRNAKGEPFVFEFLDDSPVMLRVEAPWARNLQKLGITVTVRMADYALLQKRLDGYDFDVTSLHYGDTQSPGNELYDLFSSKAAATPGSGNIAGVRDPAIDALIERVVRSDLRADRVTAVRALDRVLRNGYYAIPHWYSRVHRVAYKPALRFPDTLPQYYSPASWIVATWWRPH